MKRMHRLIVKKYWVRVRQSAIVAALCGLGCILQGCAGGIEDDPAASGLGAGEEEVGAVTSALSVGQTFDIYNGTSTPIYRTYGGGFLPSVINPYTYVIRSNYVQERTTTSQVITYTTNPSNPYGQAKTCTWTVTTSYNSGYCSVNAYATSLGLQGAYCPYGFGSINTSNCQFYIYMDIY